jgi:hypothetical protein
MNRLVEIRPCKLKPGSGTRFRESIVALIQSDLDAVLWLTQQAVEAIRQSHMRMPA